MRGSGWWKPSVNANANVTWGYRFELEFGREGESKRGERDSLSE